jgi:hypothetical protein
MFPDLLVKLISSRPGVYAEAMDSFVDLRALIVRVIQTEFERYQQRKENDEEADSQTVSIKLNGSHKTHLPLQLLRSCCVLLSIWKETNDRSASAESVADTSIDGLVDALLQKDDICIGNVRSGVGSTGLASATMCQSGVSVASVESVSHQLT